MQAIPKYAASSSIGIPDVEVAQYNIKAGAKMLCNFSDTDH
jgi:hypothetical protein